jgi:hypothetical protein
MRGDEKLSFGVKIAHGDRSVPKLATLVGSEKVVGGSKFYWPL